jgi:hypothetical protein
MRSAFSGLSIVGAFLTLLGLIGLAIPVFTTQQTRDVAKIGDLKIQTTQDTSFVIPPLLSGGTLVVGIVMFGASFFRKR